MDLWVRTDQDTLIRADWVVGVRLDSDRLKVTTASTDGAGRGDRWDMSATEHTLCAVGQLRERDRDHGAQYRLVELLARARMRGTRGVITVRDGKLTLLEFRHRDAASTEE